MRRSFRSLSSLHSGVNLRSLSSRALPSKRSKLSPSSSSSSSKQMETPLLLSDSELHCLTPRRYFPSDGRSLTGFAVPESVFRHEQERLCHRLLEDSVPVCFIPKRLAGKISYPFPTCTLPRDDSQLLPPETHLIVLEEVVDLLYALGKLKRADSGTSTEEETSWPFHGNDLHFMYSEAEQMAEAVCLLRFDYRAKGEGLTKVPLLRLSEGWKTLIASSSLPLTMRQGICFERTFVFWLVLWLREKKVVSKEGHIRWQSLEELKLPCIAEGERTLFRVVQCAVRSMRGGVGKGGELREKELRLPELCVLYQQHLTLQKKLLRRHSALLRLLE